MLPDPKSPNRGGITNTGQHPGAKAGGLPTAPKRAEAFRSVPNVSFVEIQIKQQELDQEQLARFIKWKNWATKHADRLNPVKQKIVSVLNPVEEEESKLHLW
jgi:hypothetical protein